MRGLSPSIAASFLNTLCRGEGLTIQDSSHDDLPAGYRIVSGGTNPVHCNHFGRVSYPLLVDGVSIIDMSQMEVRKIFPVTPTDRVITVCLESDLMGINESNPVVRIPMWREAKRVPSRSSTPVFQLQQQQQQQQQHQVNSPSPTA